MSWMQRNTHIFISSNINMFVTHFTHSPTHTHNEMRYFYIYYSFSFRTQFFHRCNLFYYHSLFFRVCPFHYSHFPFSLLMLLVSLSRAKLAKRENASTHKTQKNTQTHKREIINRNVLCFPNENR